MFIVISPAKKLLANPKLYSGVMTAPSFSDKTEQLVRLMKEKTVAEIASLMSLSKTLAQLNFDRYQEFPLDNFSIASCYPALLLFQGDVYQGLQAHTFNSTELDYAQQHLGILSGLYGLLKPQDAILPYRLEMGVRLHNAKGSSLYDFWRDTLTTAVNEHLMQQSTPLLVNLASVEYFKVLDKKKIKSPILTVHFYEQKNDKMKMIALYAKKARGMMARYLIQNQISNKEGIKNFDEAGYSFSPDTSSDNEFHFVRVQK